MDFFALFFDDAIIQMLVDGTNNYADEVIAEKERAGSLTPQSRWRTWKSVTIFEMRAVLAVIVNMGVIHCPERESYWKTSLESYIPFFHDVLPRNRFGVFDVYFILHFYLDLSRYSGCSTSPNRRRHDVWTKYGLSLTDYLQRSRVSSILVVTLQWTKQWWDSRVGLDFASIVH